MAEIPLKRRKSSIQPTLACGCWSLISIRHIINEFVDVNTLLAWLRNGLCFLQAWLWDVVRDCIESNTSTVYKNKGTWIITPELISSKREWPVLLYVYKYLIKVYFSDYFFTKALLFTTCKLLENREFAPVRVQTEIMSKLNYRGVFETNEVRRHYNLRNKWSLHLNKWPNGTGPAVQRSKHPLLASWTRCKCSIETSRN